MTTLDEADTTMRHASVMSPDPPQRLTPAPVPHASAPRPSGSHDSPLSGFNRPKPLNISTSDISTTTFLPVAHHDDSTPPTSAISSQLDSQGTGSPGLSDRKQHVVEALKKEAVRERRTGSASQSPEPNSLSGTKRTATGQLKRSSVNGLADIMAKSHGPSHSRTSSMVSNGSNSNANVLEVSQQLRTKLKYAMIKVQNGWQSRTFDEVESLASQSPRSTVSGFQHFHEPQSLLSPRTVMARQYQRESSESDSSDSIVAVENRGLANMVAAASGSSSRRALAPPADIMPGSRRRPTPNASYHNGNGFHAPPRHGHSSRPSTSQRTPSQNAAMEADAVETLLFMASPNNSGYNPPTRVSQESSTRSAQIFSSQTSPLRTQFSQASMVSPKKVAFSDQRPPNSTSADFDKAALIDRMLDDLSDDSDDGLERAFRLAEKSSTTATTVST